MQPKHRDPPPRAPTRAPRTLSERPRGGRRSSPTCPRDFGPYRIESSLGRGGMGEVFKAWDARLKRHVALKLILDDEPYRVARFQHEAQAQARVEHPHVCQVYEVGEHDGQHYIAMQHIDGEQLNDALEGATLEQKLTVMKSVAEALHAAHRQGLVHRDVKPSNIMVETGDGGVFKPYVLDFGLALEQTSQITTTFELVGTPQFMAPEQLNEEARLDRRTDVYGLGTTFYTVIAGRAPFRGALGEVMRQVVEVDPAPLRTIDSSLPIDVETIVAKCLEKEPQHRYESARALADDLERYLNGEPIEARPHTLSYRLVKKARKHRRLLTLAVASVLALTTSLAWGWHSRWTATQKTRLAQRLGQQVEKIESLARFSEMLPLHDVSEDRDRIRALMREIEEEMRQLGPDGEAPGHYALGRGHLVLRDGEKAHRHLQAAWDAGYREPDAALALGQALGLLYQRGFEELRRIPEDDSREHRRAALDAELRTPALELLQLGAGATLDSPELVRAQLTYYAGQLPEALDAARATAVATPWIYEARVLEGHIYARRAQGHQHRGEYEESRTEYRRALQAYETALEIGRSHVAALEAVCDVRLQLAQFAMHGSGERVVELFDESRAACRRALVVDPKSSEALEALASLHNSLGGYLAGRGEDPRPSYQAAIARAEEAIAARPGWAFAFNQLGDAHLRTAVYEMQLGEDPSASLAAGAAALKASIEATPGLALTHASLGKLRLYELRYRISRGEAPGTAAQQAIAAFERAIELEPETSSHPNNLGIVHLYLAFDVQQKGREARGILAEALRVLRRAAELNPKNAFVHANIGDAYLIEAQQELWTGLDPSPTIDHAVAAYETSLEIFRNYARAYVNTAQVLAFQADWELEAGRDPTVPLERARSALRQALEINPNDGHAQVVDILLELTRNEWRAQRGEPLELAPSIARLEGLLGRQGDNVDALLALAEAHRLSSSAAGDSVERRRALTRGLECLSPALELQPERAEAHGLRATLQAALAELSPAGEAAALRRSAVASLRRALELNPFLDRQYAPLAERLGS